MNQKMGKMTSLSKLSGIKSQPPSNTSSDNASVIENEPKKTEAKVEKQTTTKKEKLVKVNINIRKDQKDWLSDTASLVRDNNTEPVPPSQRVYPQHLIGVAIDLLQSTNVDWDEVKNVEELREHLNL